MNESHDDDELEAMRGEHAGRTRTIAWILIVALVIGGGGATVAALLFG